MVLLTLTPAAKAAVEEYFRLSTSVEGKDHEAVERLDGLREVEVGSQVRHSDLIDISSSLVKQSRQQHGNTTAKEWRLDTLLKGASVYQPPPPPKPEPVCSLGPCSKHVRLTCSADTRIQSTHETASQGRGTASI